MEKKCKKCNKAFVKGQSESVRTWNGRMYCSHNCANSVNSLGNKHSVGRVPWNKGKKFPELSGNNNPMWARVKKECLVCETEFEVRNYRKNIAKFCCKKCSEIYRDEGKTSENERIRKGKEYKLWRELVYEKDDWTCQKCLIRGENLNPHHIESFSDNEEKRFDIDNGITFCRNCHYNFHSKYGFRNNNQEQINEFLTAGQEA